MAKPVKVFVSYSWEQEKHTRIVDELEGLCRQRNIQLIRDKNEMQHGELIKEFMDQLSGGEHIITVFSDAYFKSKWCMFELLEVWRKGDFKDRTYPIQADDCDLVDRNYRLSLVTHWKKLHEEEKAILDGLDPGVILDEFRYVNLYRDIYQNINELMNFSASRMTTELGQLRARDYGQIFDLINPSSQLKTGNSSANQRKASSMDKIKAKKILYLEEQLEIWEDKLNDFKKDYARAEGSEKKFAIKRHIQDEINPEISRINEQYIHLIKDVEVAETEADPIVEELVKVFEGANIQLADAHQQQLDTILREIRDQNKSAAAKLKIALPIIPMLVNYELELDTENFLGELWGKIRGLLNKKAEDKPEDLSAKAALAQSTSQSGKKDSEFLVEINKSIAKALSASGMSVYTGVLWEELNKVLDLLDIDQIDNKPELIAEWLVVALKNGGDECLVITQALSGSVYRCFDFEEDSEKYEQTKADHKTIIKGVEKILGYLVLSLVNPKDARNLMEWIGNGDLSGMYFELHVRTMGGVELFMSYQQRKKADLKLGSDGKEITGKHLIFVNTTPFQWSIKAKLQDTQLIVWNKFYDDDRTSALSDDEIETLAADILTARVRFRDSANYCIVIDFEDDGDVSYVTQCSTFLSKLKIPMVRYKVNGSDEKAFYGRETNLMSAVKQFLIDFNKCMYL